MPQPARPRAQGSRLREERAHAEHEARGTSPRLGGGAVVQVSGHLRHAAILEPGDADVITPGEGVDGAVSARGGSSRAPGHDPSPGSLGCRL